MSGQALVLTGPSGAGKSDLAARLIDRGAALIGDDIVDIDAGRVVHALPHLRGVMEMRGVGLVSVPHVVASAPLGLEIQLCARSEVPRIPHYRAGALGCPVISLWPFAASAPIQAEWAMEQVRRKAFGTLENLDVPRHIGALQ